jgi:hypothetical protein
MREMFNLKLIQMRKITLLIIAIFGLALISNAQDEKSDYTMYKTVYLEPDYENLKEFGEALSEHNKKFHSEGSKSAWVWMVNSGPQTGQLIYVVGPTTFTDMDSWDMSAEHGKHWREEVMPYVESVSHGEFWRMNDELSYNPEDVVGGKEVLTFFDINDFEGYRFKEMIKKVKAVYVEKEYPQFFQVYYNQFWNNDGRDAMIAGNFENWAFFDRERTFMKDFEEIHGEGSWITFMEEWRDVVESAYDEIIIYVPELSGPEE